MFQLSHRNLLRLIASSTLCASSLSVASPLLTLSDNAALYFVGSASVTADSNVAYSNTNELDDVVFDIRPGFELVAGSPETGASFALSAAYGLRRYMDFDEFDTELPSIVGEATFKSAKSTTTASASYIETQAENRRGLRGVVLKSAITDLGFLTEYDASAKTSLVGGVSFRDTNREEFGSDYTDFSVPVNVYYAATEKLDVGLGYRYRDSSVDGSVFGDRSSHFVNLGLRGELTPKLVADLKVGFQTTDVDRADSVDGLALDAKLTYSASIKSTFDIVLSKDLLVGFGGEVIDNLSVGLVGNYRFSEAFSANAMAVVGTDSYESVTRDDDYRIVQVGVMYSPVYFMSVEAAYMWMDNDSNLAGLDFTKDTLMMSVNLRY